MADLNKLFTGQSIKKFPGRTFNTLVAGEIRDRGLASNAQQVVASTDKSTVLVRLAWDGEEALGIGHVVKLGDVIIEPSDEEGAPFAGLQFKCSAFEEGDSKDKYALTIGPIEAASDGKLSIGYGVMPNAWWAKVDVADEADTTCTPGAPGTLLESGSGSIKILWKESGTGEKWAVVFLGGGGNSTLRKARVYTTIPAATDELEANWGKTGEVKFMDDSTGVLDSDPTTVWNDNIDMTFAEDAQVIVDTSYSPPRVMTGTCSAVTWSS